MEIVRQAKVIGWPHPIWGESIEACVVLKQTTVSEQEQAILTAQIFSVLRQNLSSYKLPSHLFFFEDFPLTAAGKTDRRLLLQQVGERMSRLPQ